MSHVLRDSWSLMIHGGAGTPDPAQPERDQSRPLASIRSILEQGREILQRGGSALEAVEATVALLEDDPLFNAGRGSVLNELGGVEMDAAIMDGRDLSAGAVAAVARIANPVRLARLVLARSGHVLLAGAGALRFAGQCGMAPVPESWFLTETRVRQFEEARRRDRQESPGGADPDRRPEPGEPHYGTVGAVARDRQGNLAAATSTGGVVNKRMGRVGDSPIIGAGVFADNTSCAVSATGHGEDLLRTVLAKTIADRIEATGCDAGCAVRAGIDYLVSRVNGRGGVIVIDAAGNCASGFSTQQMIHGWIEHGGETRCACTQPCASGSG